MTRTVFVSHSSKDAAEANDLVRELEARDITCWIAPRDIRPGEAYDEAIVAAIEEADALVVLVSRDSITSRHVRSEVVRASSDAKTIYPVRLIDIEVAGGLQFHLELSQWVDFFPSPTAEAYDNLAEAIKTGQSAVPGTIRQGANPRRWAFLTLAGVAALLVAAFGLSWAYSSWQMRQDMLATEQEMKRFEEDQARWVEEQDEAAFASLDVKASFWADQSGFYLRRVTLVRSSFISRELFGTLSINGGQPQSYPIDMSAETIRLDPADLQSLTFRVTDADGVLSADFDLMDDVRDALANAVLRFESTLSSAATDNYLTCFAAGCLMHTSRSGFCDASVRSVALQQGDLRHEVPEGFCDTPNDLQTYCVTAPELPFPLVPGESFDISYRLVDGSERKVSKVIRHRQVQNEAVYAQVPAVDGTEAPVLVANYTAPDVTVGSFSFAVGWGECGADGRLLSEVRDRGAHLFVDIDGNGMIRVNQEPFFFSYFNPGDEIGGSHPNTPIRLPAGRQSIEIAFGGPEGIKAGPWTYDFDPAAVARATAAQGLIPEISCTGARFMPRYAGYSSQDAPICLPTLRQAFFDVAAVEFGPSPHDFSTRIEIDFDAEDYLTGQCDVYESACDPFIFAIPEDWPAVNSRVVMKDGRILSQMRHPFQR